MAVLSMTQDAKAAARVDAAASSRKAALVGPAFLVTIAVAMTAWIGALVWGLLLFLTWLVS
jgi:hypothetical protein